MCLLHNGVQQEWKQTQVLTCPCRLVSYADIFLEMTCWFENSLVTNHTALSMCLLSHGCPQISQIWKKLTERGQRGWWWWWWWWRQDVALIYPKCWGFLDTTGHFFKMAKWGRPPKWPGAMRGGERRAASHSGGCVGGQGGGFGSRLGFRRRRTQATWRRGGGRRESAKYLRRGGGGFCLPPCSA